MKGVAWARREQSAGHRNDRPQGTHTFGNRAAQKLFAPGDAPIHGQPIAEFLPSLETVVQQHRSTSVSAPASLPWQAKERGNIPRRSMVLHVRISSYPFAGGNRCRPFTGPAGSRRSKSGVSTNERSESFWERLHTKSETCAAQFW
jgi:hypothetical protein